MQQGMQRYNFDKTLELISFRERQAIPMERIDKLIASQGAYSRKEVKSLVRGGRVLLDGRTVRDSGEKADAGQSVICIDGKQLRFRRYLYLMLNKPQGVVSATRDAAQETVLDLVPPALRRADLFPAGRLDRDTTGFVLITDDGVFAHRILAPKSHIEKTYEAVLAQPVTQEDADAFAQGIALKDGYRCLPARVRPFSLEDGAPAAEVILCEGKYHQIKRMFAARGNAVFALHRTKMGGLALDNSLAPGGCREMTPDELRLLAGALFTE